MMVPTGYWLAILGLAVCLCASGCRDREQVEHYQIPRPAAPPATDRMLGAIVPVESQVWFFKIAGPIEQVDACVDPFKAYLESLQFTDGKPQGTLPSGWTEQEKPSVSAGPGPGRERFATIKIEATPPLELAITALPMQGDADKSLLANVNRWRGQMSLPPISKEDLPDQTSTLSVTGTSATFVSLLGRLKPNVPGRGPFMGGGDGQ